MALSPKKTNLQIHKALSYIPWRINSCLARDRALLVISNELTCYLHKFRFGKCVFKGYLDLPFYTHSDSLALKHLNRWWDSYIKEIFMMGYFHIGIKMYQRWASGNTSWSISEEFQFTHLFIWVQKTSVFKKKKKLTVPGYSRMSMRLWVCFQKPIPIPEVLLLGFPGHSKCAHHLQICESITEL